MQCQCRLHPGKFEGEPPATLILYEQTMAGGADEECGAYALYRAPIMPVPEEPIDNTLRSDLVSAGYCQKCIADSIARLQGAAGAITHQSEQGFETHEIYITKECLETTWEGVLVAESGDDD